MFKISNHICSELENSSVILKKLELTERGKILDLVLKKYIDSSKTGGGYGKSLFSMKHLMIIWHGGI